MPKSQNGWTASPDLKTRVIKPVSGLSLRIADNDNLEVIFTYVAQQFDAKIEKIVGGELDDWGFAYRANRNDPNSLSNHSSGTAIDLNATQHPNGVATARTFSAAEIAKIHDFLDDLDEVVRWGGDYKGTPDSMHFEINVPPSSPKVAALAQKLKPLLNGAKPVEPTVKYEKLSADVKPGKRAAQVRTLQKLLLRAGYGPIPGSISTYYGENTENAVNRFHKKNPEFADKSKEYDGEIGPRGFEFLQKQVAAKK